jgi:hypothetical protein
MARLSCAEIRELLPELALGIADGKDRALVLEHTGGCEECRRELEELSMIANDLVALAPPREPPGGFEGRVLERLRLGRAARRPRRRAFRRLGLAAAVAAAVAVTAVVMTLSYSSDRRLASQYRAALHGAHGQYFQSARLRAADGRLVGNVFGYQGSPSWLFYVLDGRYNRGLYREQIVTRAGKSVTLPRFRLVAASWGIVTPIPLRDIARVRLIREPHGPTFEASVPTVER